MNQIQENSDTVTPKRIILAARGRPQGMPPMGDHICTVIHHGISRRARGAVAEGVDISLPPSIGAWRRGLMGGRKVA